MLIPGLERTILGRHILLLNFGPSAESVESFEDLAALKERERGLVVVPHPFYPLGNCLGRRLLNRYRDLFDAVEVNAMYAPGINFNNPAIAWARRHGKPLVGNGDVHRLDQLGTTYSLVEAQPDPQSICDAIRAGHVEVISRSLSWMKTIAIVGDIMTMWLWRPSGR